VRLGVNINNQILICYCIIHIVPEIIPSSTITLLL
jgi:hypothetical protein